MSGARHSSEGSSPPDRGRAEETPAQGAEPSLASRLSRARAGDGQAAWDLLAPHVGAIGAVVRLEFGEKFRKRESVSDLVQSVCREVLERIDVFRGASERSFRAWLMAIARGVVADRARYHGADRRDPRHEVRIPDHGSVEAGILACYATLSTPSRQAMAHEQMERLEAAFDLLSDEHRRVLTLATIGNLSHREIAAELACSEEACRKLLSRARAKLAVLLDRG
jgi:RNA polymerase sigma-70 factor (subfamily 1)